MLKIIEGNLLSPECDAWICHQTNCVTSSAAGLAKAIFDKWPHTDVYKDREVPSIPGSIVRKDFVINMMAQYYPGAAMSDPPSIQNDKRFEWFRQCLGQMMHLKGTIAFPWRIGCGIAGGDWDRYLGVIARFERVAQADVTIYRLKDEPR